MENMFILKMDAWIIPVVVNFEMRNWEIGKFVQKFSRIISLLTIIPVVVPIATAFATVRLRVTLSPQEKNPLIVVL